MPANLENSAVATGLEKVRFHSNPKECSSCHTNALILHANKVIIKIQWTEEPGRLQSTGSQRVGHD